MSNIIFSNLIKFIYEFQGFFIALLIIIISIKYFNIIYL